MFLFHTAFGRRVLASVVGVLHSSRVLLLLRRIYHYLVTVVV